MENYSGKLWKIIFHNFQFAAFQKYIILTIFGMKYDHLRPQTNITIFF